MKRFAIALIGLALLVPAPAYALTSKEVLALESKERGAWFVGTLEMYAVFEKSQTDCALSIVGDYNRTEQIIRTLQKYEDRIAVAVLYLTVQKLCDPNQQAPDASSLQRLPESPVASSSQLQRAPKAPDTSRSLQRIQRAPAPAE